jgi:hypothetical protein
MSSNSNYVFYWAPTGSPAYPSGYQTGLKQFFEDLAHDSGGEQNVESIARQYGDGGGKAANYNSKFAGVLTDTTPYPANGCVRAAICLTDAQLRTELNKFIVAHALPRDRAHEYFILTPPKVEDCFEATGLECSAGSTAPSYCAYHSAFTSGTAVVIYANDPYVTGISGCDTGEHPNGKPSDGAILGGLSHEHNESITDPELNAWFAASGEENGDKCRTFEAASEYGTPLGKAPNGSRYNQVINTHLYWYQQEWSNEGTACKQRLALTLPVVTKLAPTQGPVAGGTLVRIIGTGFTAATAVHFGAQTATFKFNSSKQITAVAPAGPVSTVDVTVTNAVGTSAIAVADRYKYAPTVTSISPKGGTVAGGTSVTVTGTGFALGSGTVIKFGTTNGTSVNCTTSTSCTVTAPAHAAEAVDVKATVSGVSSSKTTGDVYTYS